MIRDLIAYPDPVLLSPARLISFEPVSDSANYIEMSPGDVADLIIDLIDTVGAVPWGRAVGLAAPQIGRPVALFVALGEAFINPRIVKHSSVVRNSVEHCYSMKEGESFRVERYRFIDLQWFDGKLKHQKRRFHRFDAQVIQHEYDHLLGLPCSAFPCRSYIVQ